MQLTLLTNENGGEQGTSFEWIKVERPPVARVEAKGKKRKLAERVPRPKDEGIASNATLFSNDESAGPAFMEDVGGGLGSKASNI